MEETKTKPTKAQIETLMSDWLEGTRDGETFVHKNTEGAIHRTLGSTVSEYSRGRLQDTDPVEILKQAREIAQGVVDGMTDTRIKVAVGGNGSYTDGSGINVATDYFDDPSLSVGEKVDILTGFAVHEACHIRHTDFGKLKGKRDADENVSNLKKQIDNILEDERIEHLLGESQEKGGDGMPGLTDYIAACKRHSFGRYDEVLQGKLPTEPLPKLLNTLLGAVRYPSMLTEEMVSENFDELDAIRKVLRPFPQSTKGVEAATDRIVDIMRDMLKKQPDDSKQQEQQGDDQKKDQQQPQSGKGSGQQGSNGNGNAAGQPSPQTLEQALQSGEAKAVLGAIGKAVQAAEAGNGNNASCVNIDSNQADYVNGDIDRDVQGGGAGGRNCVTYIHPQKGDMHSYRSSLERVKRYVPAMAKALRCQSLDHEYVLMGEKSGKLNTNKLVSLKTGNYNIFTKKGEITSDRLCLCLLIDESGSMSGGGRLNATRDAAVLIREAVRQVPNLSLFIYGFGRDDLYVYCENGREDKWALGNTKASGGTPTAAAMRISAERIRKRTSDGCLMLILTDGEPNDIIATKEQDTLLQRRGFLPIGVDIVGETHVSKVFKHSISTTDMKTLAPTLAQFVKQKLSKMIKKHDSAA